MSMYTEYIVTWTYLKTGQITEEYVTVFEPKKTSIIEQIALELSAIWCISFDQIKINTYQKKHYNI